MISKTRLHKEIERLKEITEIHNNPYFKGYQDALRWVHKNYNFVSCPLKKVECMGGECLQHYKCQTCKQYHTRGSNEKVSNNE